MIRLFIFLTFATFLNFYSYAQTTDTREKHCATDRPRHYELMANRVSHANGVTPDTLRGDVAVIKMAQVPLDQYYMKKGAFDVCDVDRVTELTWMEIRQEDAHESFTKDQFVKKAEEWGGLRIKSKPSGATIWVDEAQWNTPTDAEDMTHVGKRKITLHLEGYDDSTGYKEVIAGIWVDYKQTLNKKK